MPKKSKVNIINEPDANAIVQSKEKPIVPESISIASKYNKLLKEYWGYSSLKDEQYQVISNIIDGKDVIAILATGFGKSVCYQLPVLITKKCVIVISPLIALMHEQGQEMENKNIPVCVFNSTCQESEKNLHKDAMLSGEYKLIYMTPEYLLKSEKFIKQLDKNNNLAMICIDEAHAVSTWGLDFRTSYTKLNVIREWVDTIPILTLTATATTKVKDDIIKILGLVNPFEIIGNFDRPNLFIKVLPRSDDIMLNIGTLLNKYKNEYIIIYCKTRDETDKLAETINNYGIKCDSYHAGISDKKRNSIQQDFIDGNIKCIIATIAFGMGINIPNVRLVIHYNCPKNIESYYQEIGRAGRDGKPSECYLFHSTKDFYVNRIFLKTITDPVYKNYQETQIRLIEKYVYANECRRKLLLVNFGQHMNSCINCDNCQNKTNMNNNIIIPKQDYTKQVYLLLNLLTRIDNKFGMLTIINILIGSGKKLKEYLTNFEEFGTGISFGNEFWWRLFLRVLINEDYLIETQVPGLYGTTIGLTNKGKIARKKLVTQYPKYLNLLQAALYKEDDTDPDTNYDEFKLMFEQIIVETKSKIKKIIKSTKPTTYSKLTNNKPVSKQIINIIEDYQSDDDNNKNTSYTFNNNNVPSVFMKYSNISDSDEDNNLAQLEKDLSELSEESEKNIIKEEIIVVKPKRKYTKKENKK
jgi:Werner syndrome ATP-dependent helicase